MALEVTDWAHKPAYLAFTWSAYLRQSGQRRSARSKVHIGKLAARPSACERRKN